MVLASCSDYFRAMFTDEMRERGQAEIRLNGVSAAGLHCLLEYAYTSRLSLNLANVQDVLAAAAHVQVLTVVEACSNYLQVSQSVLWLLSGKEGGRVGSSGRTVVLWVLWVVL